MRLYVNGSLVHTNNSLPTSFGDTFPQFNEFQIGNRDQDNPAFQGLIDEVAVYDRPLTAAERFNLRSAKATVAAMELPHRIQLAFGEQKTTSAIHWDGTAGSIARLALHLERLARALPSMARPST